MAVTWRKSSNPQPETDQSAILKYQKPKILLMDVHRTVESTLKSLGYNVSIGSFGEPYKVRKIKEYAPVIASSEMPNHKEQEIIVIDLTLSEIKDTPSGQKRVAIGEPDWWASCAFGVIDPRPRAMAQVQDDFERILNHGGIFIVFAQARYSQDLIFSTDHNEYGSQKIEYDNWSFLDDLRYMKTHDDHGNEMKVIDSTTSLGSILEKYIGRSKYACTLYPSSETNKWTILAKNKFGSTVSLARKFDNDGTIFVFPQIEDKAGFLSEMVKDFLPEYFPALFPGIEKGLWINSDSYELPAILELRARKSKIQETADKEIGVVEDEIAALKKSNEWMFDLLTAYDKPLVVAIKEALRVLGFQKVKDVDEEQDQQGKSRREDLQIHDRAEALIVDIKGIGNTPTDEDARQAEKHAVLRMKEWERTNVLSLAIINHQRHLPPLERENNMPFRQEMLDYAQDSDLGLMTTWDLYRLVRNTQRYGWRKENIQSLFYRKGRAEIVPEHYEYIGKIAKAWTDKFGVVLEGEELKIGDTVAIEFQIEFEEITIASMMVDDKQLVAAKKNDKVGLLWPSDRPKLKEGLRVFRIRQV